MNITNNIRKGVIATLTLTLALVSCSRMDKETFSNLSFERVDDALVSTSNILTAPANGWVLQLYPSEDLLYGGFNILVKFSKDNTFEALSEIEPKGSNPEVGEYTIANTAGPTLTFNTYVRGIHAFSEPQSRYASFVDVSNTIERNNYSFKGAGGDYSFQIISASPDSVILRGIRSGVKAKLYPAPATPWSEQRNQFEAATELFDYPKGAKLSINGKEYPFRTERRHIYVDVDGKEISQAFVFESDGLKLYSPLVIDGKVLDQLHLIEINGESSIQTKDGGISVVLPKLLPIDVLKNNLWYFDFDLSTSDYIRPALSDAYHMALKLRATNGSPINFAFLGNFSIPSQGDSGYGFWVSFDGREIMDQEITYLIPLKLEELGEDEVKTTFDWNAITDGSRQMIDPNEGVGLISPAQIFSSSLGVKVINPENPSQVAYPWGKELKGNTYKIQVDNLRFPTKVTLTNKENPKEVLILVKDRPYYTRTDFISSPTEN